MISRPHWLEGVGLAYILAVLLQGLLNIVIPWFGWMTPPDSRGPVIPGLVLLGWAGVVVLVLVVWRGDLTARQWHLVVAVAAWCATPALSMVLHGSLQDTRFWPVAFTSVTVAAAGAVLSARTVRRLMYCLGWFFGWGSVLAGISDVVWGWPEVLVLDADRFAQWLAILGIDVDEVASLNGLVGGRIFLGMTCAVLLVYVVRAMTGRATPAWMWAMPVGLALAAMWSFARVGWFAILVGLLAALLPWERIRSWWLTVALLVLAIVPLVLLLTVGSKWIPDGTTRWRFDLWDEYLADPAMLGPFGIGPQNPPDWVRGHAHQQFLESQATGGWLAIAGLVGFLILGAVSVRAAAYTDNRAAIAVLFAAVAIFQIDVVTFAPTFVNLNNAFVLIVVVVLSSARVHADVQSHRHETVAIRS
ncbi:MAG: O-antigen ligase domain-containing protein [Actinobacteria bacterium]|nr:MAG: O-antigen ligase domain-containing protein [Actinomycetota bacterium]